MNHQRSMPPSPASSPSASPRPRSPARHARRPARRSATASPRAARTTAAPPSTPAPASARRRTTTRPNGSTSPRARARSWAARRSAEDVTVAARIAPPHPAGRDAARPGRFTHDVLPPARPAAGIGLRAPHVAAGARRTPGRAVARGPQRELLRRRRPRAGRADAHPRRLSAVAARRRACRSARPIRSTARISRKLARLIARTEPALVSEHLCWSGVGGRAPERPAAAAVHRGSAGARLRARRRGAGCPRPRDPGRERVVVPRVRRRDDSRMGVRRRRRAPHRLQAAAATSTTSTSTRSTTASTPTPISRRCRARRSPRSTSPASTRRATCLIDTHGAPVAPAVWALYRRAIARFGPRPDADRMGHRHSAARDAARRGGDGAGNPGDARCRRCVSCSRTSPTRCSRATARRRRSRRFPADRAAERIAIYRRALFANYRNALAATLSRRASGWSARRSSTPPSTRSSRAHPSTSGDLNVYGDAFGAFLAAYPPAAATCRTCRRRARSNGRMDEAHRAADDDASPDGGARRRSPSIAAGATCRRCGSRSRRRAGWSRRAIRSCASGR